MMRKLFLLTLPAMVTAEIEAAYQKLSAEYHEDASDVAVRSSATAEDLPSASFAGQQETFLQKFWEAEFM